MIAIKDPGAAEALADLDEDQRQAARAQIRTLVSDLDEEWEILNMLGLEQ